MLRLKQICYNSEKKKEKEKEKIIETIPSIKYKEEYLA
jgi:hypothetical protein